MRAVAKAFFARPALVVARDLLGCVLVNESEQGRVSAMIVETEAYSVDDPGSHSFRGQTPRNAPMFEEPGHAYVYFTYGMHWMLNAVTDRPGHPGAVLLRAAEPIDGIAIIQSRRNGAPIKDLLRGPARLAQGFGVNKELNRHDLTKPPLYVAPGERLPEELVRTGPRIGLGEAQDGRAWRFWIDGNPHVSPHERVKPTGRVRRMKAST
ncbi:MAG: DNA-3-methyladenine glycosylase [Actinomycetota bacterium]